MSEHSLVQKLTLKIDKDGVRITTYNLPIYTIKGTHLLGRSLVNQTKQHKVTKIYI